MKLLIHYRWTGPLLIALLAFIVVSWSLDPAGDYPASFEGPGLTVDEIFNVSLGATLADRVLNGDIPGTIKAGQTLPDHPPLGRLWLGLFHEVLLIVDPPRGPHAPLVVAAARVGSAAAFALLVWLVGSTAGHWYGTTAGYGAAVSLCLMPRVFGHAHIAALESVLNLAYVAAVISVACRWSGDGPPASRNAVISGIWLGLALLVKIQAILIPVSVAAWALFKWRWRALFPLILWGATGLLVFLCGWPWLWLDPAGNLWKYLGHASERTSIQVWYWGSAMADKAVPWHYPSVIFATTVPVSLHALGIWGVVHARFDASGGSPPADPSVARLLLWSLLFPLILFSLPGVSVYDGERLFLMVYPLWAIFVGRGCAAFEVWLRPRFRQPAASVLLCSLLLLHTIGLARLAPCWLSYYNAFTGGLPGAYQLGFQTTYWGDSLTRDFWTTAAAQLPAGSTIDIAPVLHQFQLDATLSQAPLLRERGLKLRAYNPDLPSQFLVVFSRREYLPRSWQDVPPGYRQLAAVERQGVVLAALYERQPPPQK